MESTWELRDLPVLDAIVRYFEEEFDGGYPSAQTFADRLGMDPEQVAKAVTALAPTYLVLAPSLGRSESVSIDDVTDAARRAVGQWPSPDSVVERIARALLDAADREPDEHKRSRLRTLGEGCSGSARMSPPTRSRTRRCSRSAREAPVNGSG